MAGFIKSKLKNQSSKIQIKNQKYILRVIPASERESRVLRALVDFFIFNLLFVFLIFDASTLLSINIELVECIDI